MAGLVPDRQDQTLRLTKPGEALSDNDDGIHVEVVEDQDEPELDLNGAVLSIRHGDGEVTVSLDGKPITDAQTSQNDKGWYANLANSIDTAELSRISDELLRGIDADAASRQDWLEGVAIGVKLLGLKTETPGTQGSTDGAPVEGMSKVRHPLLLEAVLRFQANARSELLPTDGPIKIRDDSNGGTNTVNSNAMADALELDMNHYLTGSGDGVRAGQ